MDWQKKTPSDEKAEAGRFDFWLRGFLIAWGRKSLAAFGEYVTWVLKQILGSSEEIEL